MSKKHRRRKRKKEADKKKKSEIDIKTWLVSAITDLFIGIILLILDKLFN